MSEEFPPDSHKTFSEKLAERPRTRILTVFTILGFVVTPVAITILLTQHSNEEEAASPGIRLEVVIAAVLIAAHFLCAFFAWRFWKNEVPRAPIQPNDNESAA